MNHLNAYYGFRGNQRCVRRLIFGRAFRKTLLERILRRVTGVFGRGHNVPPPPLLGSVVGAQNMPGWDRVKEPGREVSVLFKIQILILR